MANSSYLISKKNAYINCYNNANETARLLNNALLTLSATIDSQKEAYTLDGNSGDGGQLSRIKDKEDKVISNITRNILPRTKSMINRLNEDIEEALEKESMENGI